MWYIKYLDENNDIRFNKKIFKNKMDAFNLCRELYQLKDCSFEVLNLNNSTAFSYSDKGDSILYLWNEQVESFVEYGTISSVSNHLVNIIKTSNGDEVELTKARINKEFIQQRALIK